MHLPMAFSTILIEQAAEDQSCTPLIRSHALVVVYSHLTPIFVD